MRLLLTLTLVALPSLAQTPIFGGVTQTVIAPTAFDVIAADSTGVGPKAIYWLHLDVSTAAYPNGYGQDACQLWLDM